MDDQNNPVPPAQNTPEPVAQTSPQQQVSPHNPVAPEVSTEPPIPPTPPIPSVPGEPQPVAVVPPQPKVESSVPFTTSQDDDKPPFFSNVGSVINKASWVLMFTLAPITFIVIFAQYAVPGDAFYPVKRALENTILAAASVSPTTRAFFHADLASRRFDEAEKLLVGSADVKGLSEFVDQIQVTQQELQSVSDPVKKEELAQKLQTSIADYEKRLIAVKSQIEATSSTISQPSETNTGQETQAPASEPTASQTVPTQPPAGQTTQPTSLPTAVPTLQPGEPTRVPTVVPPTPTRVPTTSPTNVPTVPTHTPTPTSAPQQPPSTPGGAVNVTIDYLACLREHSGNPSACTAPILSQQAASQTAPTPTRVPTIAQTPESARGNSASHRNDNNNNRNNNRNNNNDDD